MTPAEHYKAAEDCLNDAYAYRDRRSGVLVVREEPLMHRLLAAQVHATLAIAAPETTTDEAQEGAR